MSGLRKRYSVQEKLKIVLEILKGELRQSQLTSKYGIHSTQLHQAIVVRCRYRLLDFIVKRFAAVLIDFSKLRSSQIVCLELKPITGF